MFKTILSLFLVSTIAGEAFPSSFEQEEQAWRKKRLERLTSEDGWLSLVALDWLKTGENRFQNLEVKLMVQDGKVEASSLGPRLLLRGKPFTKGFVTTDNPGPPDIFNVGKKTFIVIRRGERLGVRVKDPESKARKQFKGLEYFPPTSDYVVEADFIPFEKPKDISVETIIQVNETMQAPGLLKFRLRGQEVTLKPLLESPEDKEFFLIFRDETSGKETYPAGRFLYTDRPVNGKVKINFNRAYNPPCAFTHFSTCPLPPKENWLKLRVEAGERAYKH